MKFKVYFRYDFEHPPSAHSTVVSALDKEDAECLVRYRATMCGSHVVVIKCFRIEKNESNKRHNGYIGKLMRR